ncbi:GAF domain-containing protein [Rathayibacter sp. VKM Ac-2803]|uniref:GAF and ANTAR domain-containing protein n=1 Tax=unclassified Rathayibacter TaxID=2609250 RepID=UPI001358C1BF|nr:MULTISPECIES: GAF and ANTAR domain-containing protein [unclassified Rathayibacter]MWV50602.1 GAF domain-containing protein [Rathayibacter sp. VKM Ac-2803]MWV59603.1 GAF domain-containing protein [Rathayibacter sp. VKM Ac-2754]
MTARAREHDLIETFVTLSDTLVDDYDTVELMQLLVDRSASLFEAASAGLVLRDAHGVAEVLASTNEDSRLIGLLQLQDDAGPCMRCLHTGEVVVVADITESPAEWSHFRERALELGLRSVHCVPLRLRNECIGSLNLFGTAPGVLDAEDVAVVQAFADVATIGILHQRALEESDLVRSQLQRALDSRVLIEQAKGAVAYSRDISTEEAFDVLRRHARSTSTALTVVAGRVLRGELLL